MEADKANLRRPSVSAASTISSELDPDVFLDTSCSKEKPNESPKFTPAHQPFKTETYQIKITNVEKVQVRL